MVGKEQGFRGKGHNDIKEFTPASMLLEQGVKGVAENFLGIAMIGIGYDEQSFSAGFELF